MPSLELRGQAEERYGKMIASLKEQPCGFEEHPEYRSVAL